ncbi:MAG: hypothetical protein ACKV2Q_19425 [Planctomycetaceae bacterium]
MTRTVAFVAAFALIGSTTALAQLPQAKLFSVFPPGAQVGVATEVAISNGVEMDEANRLIFNHPGITFAQKVTEAAGVKTPVVNTFVVNVAAGVPDGIYEVRFGGRFGISNPRSFVVGSRKEFVEVEPNNAREQATPVELNSTVNGRTDGSAYDYFKFPGKAGQRVLCLCQGGRIDSKVKTQIELYDAAGIIPPAMAGAAAAPAPQAVQSGRRLASARSAARRDALLDVTLPADGDYFVRVIDNVYAGSADHFYRLTITTGPYIDFALPPAGAAGANAQITLFGRNLPGGQPAGVSVEGKPLEKVAVSVTVPADIENTQATDNLGAIQGGVDAFSYVWNTPAGNANPLTMFVASAPVGLEQEPNDAPAQANKLTIPAEVAGQFQSRGDVDFFTFDAKAQESYWIEAFGDRQGSLADPYITLDRVIKDDKGVETVQRITAQDDTGTNLIPNVFETLSDDPAFQFVVPADGTYRLSIRDRYYESRGDARMVYRLAIRKEAPDFKVVVLPEAPLADNNATAATYPANLRKGENLSCRVIAFRRDGYNGAIDVTVENLPAGITCKGTSIGPGQTNSTLVFSATEDAADGTFGFAKVVGKARIEDNAKVKAVADAKAAVKPAVDALPKTQQDVAKGTEEAAKFLAVRQAAETKFTADADVAKKAADAKVISDKKAADMTAAHKAAVDKLAAAKTELDKNKDNQDLKNAVAAAEKTVADADVAAKAALQEKTVADKAATDSANLLKTSEQAKTKAVTEHDQAVAKLKVATDAQAAAEKRIADANTAVTVAIAAQKAAAREVAHVGRAATTVWDGNAAVAGPISRLSRDLCLAITPEAYPFQATTDVFRVDANHNRQILVPVKLIKRNGFDENVTLTFVGTPQNAQVENKPINKGASEGVYRIFLPNNVPVGTYTLYMKATAAVQYRRRPELADKAKAALDLSVAAVTQATEALTKANVEKDVATKKAVETDAAFKKATTDKDAATKKVAETTEAVKRATEAKDKATTDADKDATVKALTASQEEAKKATDALAVADKALADSDAANKAAIAAKAKAEADAKAADDKNKAALADKAAKEKVLTDTNTATKANPVNVFTPSTPIVISVKPNAVNVTTAPANGGAVKRGDKVEVKVTIQRVNGFAGPVILELVPPPGVAGLAAEKVTIPADKAEGAILVTATGDATEGAIANAVIRASADFDGAVAASDGAVAINVQK